MKAACEFTMTHIKDPVIGEIRDRRKIATGGGMLPHVQIHCRGDPHRTLCRQIGGEEHVIAKTMGHRGEGVGRTGRDDHEIPPYSKFHMVVPGIAVRNIDVNVVTGKSSQRERRNELSSRRCHDHLDFVTGLNEATDEQGCLVCGNATADAYDYF